jgi:4-hydroxybenzoate polyprenyltransferase
MWDLTAQCLIGIAFNWGALLGWSAVAGSVDWAVCLPLYAGGVCWTLVYDSIYAHQVRTSPHRLRPCLDSNFEANVGAAQDKTDDVLAGIRSTALLFGTYTRPVLGALSASAISLIACAGWVGAHSGTFYAGVGLAAAQLARVVRGTDFDNRQSCWRGFLGCGWAGFWVWMGALGDYVMLISHL